MDITFSSYSRLGCLSPANIIIIGSRVVVGHDVMKFALTIELELKKDENLLSQIILKTLHFHHNCLLPISIPVVVTLLRIGAILVKLSETTLKKNEIARKMKSDHVVFFVTFVSQNGMLFKPPLRFKIPDPNTFNKIRRNIV